MRLAKHGIRIKSNEIVLGRPNILFKSSLDAVSGAFEDDVKILEDLTVLGSIIPLGISSSKFYVSVDIADLGFSGRTYFTFAGTGACLEKAWVVPHGNMGGAVNTVLYFSNKWNTHGDNLQIPKTALAGEVSWVEFSTFFDFGPGLGGYILCNGADGNNNRASVILEFSRNIPTA